MPAARSRPGRYFVWLLGVALTLAAAATAAHWALGENPSQPEKTPKPKSVVVDFEGTNGEAGELTAEVRVDSAAPITVQSTCKAAGGGKPNSCSVRLTLVPGRHVVSLRLRTSSGWTPWSDPTTLDVE
jgi:hypothetical protein